MPEGLDWRLKDDKKVVSFNMLLDSAPANTVKTGLLAELSISPGQRDSLKQAGGLLLLLQFQRQETKTELSEILPDIYWHQAHRASVCARSLAFHELEDRRIASSILHARSFARRFS